MGLDTFFFFFLLHRWRVIRTQLLDSALPQGAQDTSAAKDTWGTDQDDWGVGQDDWGQGQDDWGQGQDDWGHEQDDSGQGQGDCDHSQVHLGEGNFWRTSKYTLMILQYTFKLFFTLSNSIQLNSFRR